jgi:DNA-binding NtrC family response regulator
MSEAPYKLLYVEENAELLTSRSALLTGHDYEVVTADTLTKALRLFRSFSFDLLVIGHSVAERDRTALAAISKRINPKAVVLAMVGEKEKRPLADGWMTSHRETDILDAVASLLSKTERASATAA